LGVRLTLLFVSVIGLSVGSLFNPLIGLLGHIWFALARPDALAWSEGQFPFSLVLAAFTLAGTWRVFPNVRFWFGNPWVISMLFLQLVFLASIAGAANPAPAWNHYYSFLKYFVIALLIPLFVTTERELRWLLGVMAFSNALVGIRFGIFGFSHGGIRVGSGHGGFLSDNNTLALGLATGLPLIWYAKDLVRHQWQKWAVYLAVGLTIGSVLQSHSRGGILTLTITLMILVYRSRHKITMLVVLIALTLPMGVLLLDSLSARMQTLEDFDSDGSLASRRLYAITALRVFKDYPVLGLGFGTENWGLISEKYVTKASVQHVIHNNYLQMAVDSGIFALLILCWQLWFSSWWLGRAGRRLRKLYPEQPGKASYAFSLEASLIAFSIGSTFLSRTDYDFYYILVMSVGAFYTVNKTLLAESGQAATPAAAPAVRELLTKPFTIGPARPALASAVSRWRNPRSPLRTSGRSPGN
jgi:probable O-glycosylation ligase (exosortase A-associated)